MKPSVFSLLLVLCPIVAWAQNNPESRPPIIDMHLHAFDLENPPLERLQSSDSQAMYRQKTFDELVRYNIVAVTSGPSYVVKEWKRALPDRIIPGLFFFHPDEVNLDSLRASFQRGDLAVLGEMGTQYAGLAPDDPLLDPIWALAEELDIPVALHMGLGPRGVVYIGYPNYRASLSNPLLLEEVLVRHPKLRVYVMHAGWPMLDEMIHLLYSYPQVYVDVGDIDWAIPRKEFHSYLRRMVEAGYGERIMFGSDQVIWPERIREAIEAIETADFLTEKQKRDIFYNNAARFLRLKEGTKGAN